jgi:protein-disulfide isomerase
MKRGLLLLLGCLVCGCAFGKAGRGGAQASGSEPGASRCECPCAKPQTPPRSASNPPAAADREAVPAVPATEKDPTWGNPNAPVTIVEFSDFQCPFCAHVLATLEELKRVYGPERIRLVWKNFPLPFHLNARSAAEAAMTAFAMGGNPAFWRYHDLLFAREGHLDPDQYAAWAGQAGLAEAEFDDAFSAGRGSRKVDEDLALAVRLKIRGTPMFLINGFAIGGAQPIERFKEIIDIQLVAAKALVASGLPEHAVCKTLCANSLSAEPAKPEKEPAPGDTIISR